MKNRYQPTEIELRAIQFLAGHPEGASASMVGEHLFSGHNSTRVPQAYARPGGRVLGRMWKKALVWKAPAPEEGRAFVWCLTEKGRGFIKTQSRKSAAQEPKP
jgi:hypothetical protein